MTEKMLKKRNYLKGISDEALNMAKGTEFEGMTVNAQIMRFIHNPTGELEFRSFRKWKENGFTVKKGEKAFLLWGQPINKNADRLETLYNLDDAEREDIFFPVAYVFSSAQVRKVEKKEPIL